MNFNERMVMSEVAHRVFTAFCRLARLRSILLVGSFFAASAVAFGAGPIDRRAVVGRHDVQVHEVDPWSPLSVGNGDFAFTVDASGLQSYDDFYRQNGMPTETLSSWAWHTFPNPDHLRLEDAGKAYDFHGRSVVYDSLEKSPAGKYFRENPQPVPLGQLCFRYKGKPLRPEDLSQIDQRLDLWEGVIHSRYVLDGQPVAVDTLAGAARSLAAVEVRSPLLQDGALEVHLRFAYAYDVAASKNKPRLLWDQPDKHQSKLAAASEHSARIDRTVDDTCYSVEVGWEGAAALTEESAHDFRLRPSGGERLAFTCEFTPAPATGEPPDFAAARADGVAGCHDYWTHGGIIDLAASTDPRAPELERRVILSLYLMRVNYGGAFPPAETGLTHLSWFGKHNTEMYFWHAAHFYQWGRADRLEKGLAWYRQILPVAQEDARSKGFDGARWPKMTGPDGRESPGGINPFIIWNFPHAIYLCELAYRAHPDRATLEKYRDLVFETARFLASYAFYDEESGRYVLGPPLQTVAESSDVNHTRNPAFELAYWHYGLTLAQVWRERLGLPPEPHWADVASKLSKLPVADGKYLDVETELGMYEGKRELPSSMLMALGFLPQTPMVDPTVMRRTFDEINRRNGPDRWLSWSLGKAAMTAARLGETELAVGIVTNPTAVFLNNGHVRRPKEPNTCVAYLPANASLLCAVGLMAAGWDGGPRDPAPGFPRESGWVVASEGLLPMP